MPSGSARGHLATTIATVLALTAGGALAVAPEATAAPATTSAPSASPATDPLPTFEVPRYVHLVTSGPSGFLGSTEQYDATEELVPTYRWYRADGTSTRIATGGSGSTAAPNALASDTVTVLNANRRVIELRDMGAPAGTAPVVIDLNTLGSTYKYVATIGSTVLVQVGASNGPKKLHLLSKSGTTVTDDEIIGLPTTFGGALSVKATPGTAVVSYYPTDGSDRTGVVVINLATSATSRAYPLLADGDSGYQEQSVSRTKLAVWQGENLVVTDRTTGTDTTITVGQDSTRRRPALLGLLGDWITYGKSTDTDDGSGPPGGALEPLTARSLTDGRTVTLLFRAMGPLVPTADGGFLVRGQAYMEREGVYRIALGADGTPTAALVATLGAPPALTLVKTNIGSVVNLDVPISLYNRGVPLYWLMSSDRFHGQVELTHKQSGLRYTTTLDMEQYGPKLSLVWPGTFDDTGKAAFNGDYTWKASVYTSDGFDPDLTYTGDFKVVRTPKIHDYNDNGSPDLLFRDSQGNLRRSDTMYRNVAYPDAKVTTPEAPALIGGGWQTYSLIESVGDVAGTNAPDVIGRDAAGVLWLHQGTGSEKKPLADRVRIGAGWNTYNRITGGGDLTGDGRADVLATDKTGVMYLYKGTGKPSAPFATRIRLGAGWNTYTQVTAVGNVAGAAAGDLVARDTAGVLWLYLGNGNGTFAGRLRIGGGWNQFTRFIGIGDATRDGHADLYVSGPNNVAYVYQGTGSWRTPFDARFSTDPIAPSNATYRVNHVS
ncbi:FG-GAP repeat domain-containing protein [Streptomyces sp. NPDC059534]|uniref:FG-GAP repeat domain-containing protein n=1 Tax=Streptomyces sp. NPDC059534 TaxID=3346859 RepID=UPI0036982633